MINNFLIICSYFNSIIPDFISNIDQLQTYITNINSSTVQESNEIRRIGNQQLTQYIHFISKQELRILNAIEMGMKNHQYVPLDLIGKIGNLRGGQTFKIVRKLLKNKFIVHTGKKCDGYKLTYHGYDYLVLQAFMKRGLIKDVLMKIGVGKQSDIYKCITPEGEEVVLKMTRLGRNSFRTIKKNRQYIQNRTSYNWLYLSRLSASREFSFMQLLHQNNFPTPKPIDSNRHGILMSLVDGFPMCQVKLMGEQIKEVFKGALELLNRFAAYGLVHGDFNQFNLMVNQKGKITVIDFPQCISIKHPNSADYFERDVECLYNFFEKLGSKSQEERTYKFNVSDFPMPDFKSIQIVKRLDNQIKQFAHFTLTQEKQLEQCFRELAQDKNIDQNKQYQDSDQNQHSQGSQGSQGSQSSQSGEEDIERQQQLKQKIQKLNFQQSEGIAARKQSIEDGKQQLEDLLQNMGQQVQLSFKHQGNQNQEGHSDEQTPQQFKGMTNYQIRQIVKQRKRIERQKRKSQMNTNDYIKHAVKKPRIKTTFSKGNYGKKGNNKKNNQDIRQGIVHY